MNVNNVTLVGNLTRDAESKVLPSGTTAVNFILACNRSFHGGDGQWREHVAFVPCCLYGPEAAVLKAAKKGSLALVTGYLRTESCEHENARHDRLVLVAEKALPLESAAPARQTVDAPKQEQATIPF